MSQDRIIIATYQLMYASVLAMIELGCFHVVRSRSGAHPLLVPAELARYNLEGQIVWVELDAQRLPRGHSLTHLHRQGFAERISKHFNRPVVVKQIDRRIVIAGTVGEAPSANGSSRETVPSREV